VIRKAGEGNPELLKRGGKKVRFFLNSGGGNASITRGKKYIVAPKDKPRSRRDSGSGKEVASHCEKYFLYHEKRSVFMYMF